MRTGYTTGATAAAAAKAAALALLGGKRPSEVTIALPRGEEARFPLVEWERGDGEAHCGILKDAGDDPDITHGALIRATVRRSPMPGISVRGGRGVGTVTRPGLPVAVGCPAINPVPLRMIREGVEDALLRSTGGERRGGLEVTLSIPEGERLASRTLNARLGILGGLSLLGTTGIVIPYSVNAYRLSVRLALEVARAARREVAVLSTGRSSEELARKLLPQVPVESFVLAADYMGYAVQEAGRLGFRRVILAGFPGKLGKFALGHRDTHQRWGLLDLSALAALVPGTPEEPWRKDFLATSSARWAMESLSKEQKKTLGQGIARQVVRQGRGLTDSGMEIGGLIFSHEGERLGAFPFWLEDLIGG